jgi:hypothetical protein
MLIEDVCTVLVLNVAVVAGQQPVEPPPQETGRMRSGGNKTPSLMPRNGKLSTVFAAEVGFVVVVVVVVVVVRVMLFGPHGSSYVLHDDVGRHHRQAVDAAHLEKEISAFGQSPNLRIATVTKKASFQFGFNDLTHYTIKHQKQNHLCA